MFDAVVPHLKNGRIFIVDDTLQSLVGCAVMVDREAVRPRF